MPHRGRKEQQRRERQNNQADQAARQPGRSGQGVDQDTLIEAAEELGIEAGPAQRHQAQQQRQQQQQQARQRRREE